MQQSLTSSLSVDAHPAAVTAALSDLPMFQESVIVAKRNANESRRLAKTVAGSIRQMDTRSELIEPLAAERKIAVKLQDDVRNINTTLLSIGDLLNMIEAEATRHEIARKRGAMLVDVLHAARTAAAANAVKETLRRQEANLIAAAAAAPADNNTAANPTSAAAEDASLKPSSP